MCQGLLLSNPLWWHCLASHHNEHVCSCSNLTHGHTLLLLYQAIHKCHTTVCWSDQWPATVPPINQPANCNTVTYSIHLQHLSHRPLMACNRPVSPSCHVPGTWSMHKAPHKITFSDRLQFIAETVSTTKPFMHTAHHLGKTCKFIMATSTLHTKFLSHMPQISLADRHKYNYVCWQLVWNTSLTQTSLLSPEHIPYRQTIQ